MLYLQHSIRTFQQFTYPKQNGSILGRRRSALDIASILERKFDLTNPAELLNVHNAFHQGQYQTVIDFDTSSLSAENSIPASVFQLRAQIANGQAELVLANVEKQNSAPDFIAVKAFAQHTLGDSAAATRTINKLVELASDNATVQILGGTVLQATGKTEEALALLSKHQGSLEA